MKIAIIVLSIENGGITNLILNFAKELRKKGHTPIIYTLNNKMDYLDKDSKNSIKSANLPDSKVKDYISPISFLFYVYDLFRKSYRLFRLVALDIDDIDIYNPHGWISQWAAVYLKFKKNAPIVWSFYDVWHIPGNEFSIENRRFFRYDKKIILAPIDKLISSRVDIIVSLSDKINKIALNYYHKKNKVIRSGISKDFFKFKKKPSKGKKFTFLCFSIFLPYRRFEDAVNAFEMLLIEYNYTYNLKLKIVGSDKYDSNYAAKIKDLIKKKNLQKFISLDNKTLRLKEVISNYTNSDVFIYPNEKQTWALCVVEAMAIGLPCIVSDDSGIHEIIKNNNNGFIYRTKDVNALYKKMDILYKNKSLRNKIGNNASEFVYKNLLWEKFVNKMINIFKDLN